jgi:hypothetical protein
MSGNSIVINCPKCGKTGVQAVPVRVVLSMGKKYKKALCCKCKFFVHVETDE